MILRRAPKYHQEVFPMKRATTSRNALVSSAIAISAANGGAYVENQVALEYAENGAACAKR